MKMVPVHFICTISDAVKRQFFKMLQGLHILIHGEREGEEGNSKTKREVL
jgi:hypothetical protein